MAAAPLPGEGFDEEDNEFDWEAAVREIDSACQGAAASTSGRVDVAYSVSDQAVTGHCSSKPQVTNRGSRQTTLDCFVGSRGKCDDVSRESGPVLDKDADCGNQHDSGQLSSVSIDLDAAKTWIYPVNVPLRDYQFSITKTALFSNTLVALPTGLGKTLIAAVLMYNFFRWFPEGKIVFTAPSRPLVMQQIEACHNTVGIPQEWAIDMTGQLNPQKRSQFWNSKRVFFVTPQVLEKDILSGICPVKQLTCLVIDEAHRATGNYSYCVAVRELMSVPVQLRILALTATPGSKQKSIQSVIDNLCISTLEYRNENDNDVSPYVHNRKIELIEVSMCKNTVAINNMLLEVIKPFASRLCGLGVLWSRDFAALNPCELLNARDKFRQSPPANLPLPKYGEVEGYFAVLITLYHIKKLLSTHGIRPAYDMLEEKLKQGSFSRFMSRNDAIWDAKRLMQQSLSHGAPNPKLEKMKEVLADHFKTNKSKESRAIIFSNFRGSVKDIMHSLSGMGDVINATEFVGQSSGKSLKGQSQKVQQAVLQKFRSGGYNVIVATSIGEEGLDIMEVDLVICFDANISPLRMIQRMGRTGRNHDGRVVVLASTGSELKGYLKKQANGKIVGKHMHNGGNKSFDFHSSPRMIPHSCKPQVQFVELSIDQFVPRGKKMGDVLISRSPFSKKVSEQERELISRYYNSPEGGIWKPSLIAFPCFQALTSRVYRVSHSFRTTSMLIDAMQRLQGFSFNERENIFNEINTNEEIHAQVENDEKVEDPEYEVSQKAVSEAREKHDLTPKENSSLHSFLFSGEFVTVDVAGNVSVLSVPVLSLINGSLCFEEVENIASNSRSGHEDQENLSKIQTVVDSPLRKSTPDLTDVESWVMLTHLIEKTTPVGKSTSDIPNARLSPQLSHFSEDGSPIRKSIPDITDLADSAFSPLSSRLIRDHHDIDISSQTAKSSPMRKSTPDPSDMEFSPLLLMPDHPDTDLSPRTEKSLAVRNSTPNPPDIDFSPRLTHFIEKGVVPESPAVNYNLHPLNVNTSPVLEEILEKLTSPVLVNDELIPCSPSSRKTEVERELKTPATTRSKNSSSEGWQLGFEDALKSIHQTPKFKRLRRHRDFVRKLPCKVLEENFHSQVKQFCERTSKKKSELSKKDKGKGKNKINPKHFIEEEAEVSSDARGSDDEAEGSGDSSYDNSFINDGADSTETSSRAENGGNDMMAFYRRSLLTQSPAVMRSPLFPANSACDSFSPGSCSSEKIPNSLRTPGTIDNFRNKSPALKPKTIDTCENGEPSKKKLSFVDPGQTSDQVIALSDDEFYDGLDLDAVEAQATELLRSKMPVGPSAGADQFPHEDVVASPSFDLGI